MVGNLILFRIRACCLWKNAVTWSWQMLLIRLTFRTSLHGRPCTSMKVGLIGSFLRTTARWKQRRFLLYRRQNLVIVIPTANVLAVVGYQRITAKWVQWNIQRRKSCSQCQEPKVTRNRVQGLAVCQTWMSGACNNGCVPLCVLLPRSAPTSFLMPLLALIRNFWFIYCSYGPLWEGMGQARNTMNTNRRNLLDRPHGRWD